MVNLTPDFSLLVIMAIFIANYFVVRRFLIRPVNEILLAREQDVREGERRYEQALAQFNEETSRMEAKVQEAKREASALRDRLRSGASGQRSETLEKTRAEAERIVREAESTIAGDVSQARTKIDRESEALARLAAEKVLGRKIA
ncbi:MAG TPA: ATP synthase F0 subunit B [Thermoanaerobaculia bacterium]|nr:ATP synthase F0 subunit B [Thermoanaerobaculia bacterium]